MRTIARFMDARNTAEGKFLSVLLSVLLVFSFLNMTMFTDYAGATEGEEATSFVGEKSSGPMQEVTELSDGQVGGEKNATATDEADASENSADSLEENESNKISTDKDFDKVVEDEPIAKKTNSGKDEVSALSVVNMEGEVSEAEITEDAIDCPFTAEKIGTGEYVISGEGVFSGEFLFEGKKTTFPKLGYCAVKKLTLEEGITGIAEDTFKEYYVGRGLREIVLPTTLTTIGARAFYGGVLEKINLDNVKSIGRNDGSGSQCIFRHAGSYEGDNRRRRFINWRSGIYVMPKARNHYYPFYLEKDRRKGVQQLYGTADNRNR